MRHASASSFCMAEVIFRALYRCTRGLIYVWSITKKEKKTMSTIRNSIRTGFLGRAYAALGAANAVSAAVEAGRRPRARDLTELGIDPISFGQVIR